MSLGILSDPTLPLPMLLDAIAHSETGHLSPARAAIATSPKGARGMYQFMPGNLHDMGYGMPRNIPLSDVLDPQRARELAGQYVTGYTANKNFTTPLHQLVAYNAGPDFAEDWIARGENIDELPLETQQYITRAAAYLTQNQQPNTEEPQMANNTLFGLPFDQTQFDYLLGMANQGNALAQKTIEQMAAEEMNRRMAIQAGGTPSGGVLSTAANAQTTNPALTTVSSNPVPQQGTTVTTAVGGASVNSNNGRLTIPVGPTVTYSAMGSTPTNRRDQSKLAVPDLPVARNNINDMLIRMGAAGLDASAEGGLQALGAIGREYGNIKAENANNALEIYKAQMKALGKRKGGSGAASSGAAVVNDDISRSLDMIREDQDGFWTNFFKADLPATGLFSYLSVVPGTDAKALSNRLRTIQANISFDKLQAMREASPTGGALGQVSTFELQNLMAVFGSLEQSQSPADLEYNLLRLQQVYNDIIHGPGNHPYGSFVGGQQNAAAASMTQPSSNVAAARSIVAGQP